MQTEPLLNDSAELNLMLVPQFSPVQRAALSRSSVGPGTVHLGWGREGPLH